MKTGLFRAKNRLKLALLEHARPAQPAGELNRRGITRGPQITQVVMNVTPPKYTKLEPYDLRAGQTVVEALKGMREKHRFMRGLSVWVGFRQTGVKYIRAERYAGETKYPLKKMLKFALDAIARTGFDESRGRNPEVLSGRLYKSLDTAVPQQFFATSMVITPLIRGLLGLDVDAPAHKIVVAPHLPVDWDSVRVENVPVGRDRIDIAIHRFAGRVVASFTRRPRTTATAPLDVVFSPALPLGANSSLHTEKTPGDIHATVQGILNDHLTLEVPFSGGWSIIPPVMPAMIGARSRAPRVLSERLSSGKYVVALEGLAGHTYRFRIREPGKTERETDITFPATRANADGYTARTVTFGQ